MKRIDFIKEMRNSIFQTVKYAYEPFFQEDVEKVGEAADRVLGVKWLPLMNIEESAPDLEMKYIEGRPIIISRYDTNMQVMNGICPVCSNIIMVTTLYSSGKCLNCEKEYNFKAQQGNLQLESLPVKVKDNMIYLGIYKDKKQGGIYA